MYIVMGDADETYPLVELGPFVDRLEQGDDLVMGSRFNGTIHGDAMPFLNRFVGNPILTGMLNLLFGVKISDAHCGMRAITKDAAASLDLHSTGMEFASEMVFKAYRRDLKVSEIPIDYFPRTGESKLNRFGDAWRHVRFMLLYSPSWLYLVPGFALLLLGRRGHARARDRARRRLRPLLADPHDARLRRAHAHRGAGDPARRVRADLRAGADRRAGPAPRPARARAPARARSPCRGAARAHRDRRPDRGRHRVGARGIRDARPRVRDRAPGDAARARHPGRLRVVLPRAAHDAAPAR